MVGSLRRHVLSSNLVNCLVVEPLEGERKERPLDQPTDPFSRAMRGVEREWGLVVERAVGVAGGVVPGEADPASVLSFNSSHTESLEWAVAAL